MTEVSPNLQDHEGRLSRLEAVLEQINLRLDSLDRRLVSQGSQMNAGFRWLVGIQLTSWITLVALILLKL